MKNSSSKSSFLIISIAVVAIAVCLACFAIIYFLSNSTKGDLIIYSYSEAYDKPEDISKDVIVNAIVYIEPAIDNKNYFITDAKGLLELKKIPAGEYSITPLYADKSYTKKIDVKKGGESQIYVPSPFIAISFLELNTDLSTPPFNSTDIRKAIALLVDNTDYYNNVINKDTSRLALNFIPDIFELSKSKEDIVSKNYDPEEAEKLMSNISPFDITFSISSTDAKGEPRIFQPTFNFFQNAFQQSASINSVSVAPYTFSELTSTLSEKNYQLALKAWFLDSNNILEFYREFLTTGSETGYEREDIEELINEGNSAIDNQDLKKYEDCVIKINNIILNDYPMIPLSFFNDL